MEPLAQAMMTRHIISLRDKITPVSKKPILSGMVEEQYLWIPLAVRFLLFCGACAILVTWTLSMRCRIQQRKQQVPIHFEDLILRLSHPEVLGWSLIAWKPLRREVVLRETPLATLYKQRIRLHSASTRKDVNPKMTTVLGILLERRTKLFAMSWLRIKFVGLITCAVKTRKSCRWKRKELPKIPTVVWMRNIIPQFKLMHPFLWEGCELPLFEPEKYRDGLLLTVVWMKKTPDTYGIWIVSSQSMALFMTLCSFRRWFLAGGKPSLGRREEALSVESPTPYSVVFLVSLIIQTPTQFPHVVGRGRLAWST